MSFVSPFFQGPTGIYDAANGHDDAWFAIFPCFTLKLIFLLDRNAANDAWYFKLMNIATFLTLLTFDFFSYEGMSSGMPGMGGLWMVLDCTQESHYIFSRNDAVICASSRCANGRSAWFVCLTTIPACLPVFACLDLDDDKQLQPICQWRKTPQWAAVHNG